MIKMRLMGELPALERTIDRLGELVKFKQVSDLYRNRNSEYYRVYIEFYSNDLIETMEVKDD